MQPLMNIIGNIAYVAVCVFGSILAINGTIEFGVIVSFILYVRLFTSIKNADLILVMRAGDVIESGTHEELMQRGSFYADLYNSQFEQAS